MKSDLKVVHYINQFFGGIGGEEKAFEAPQVKTGAVNVGKVVQSELKERGEVVATIICGDNYFAERPEEVVGELLKIITQFKPDIVIAGPAFNAGRYGVACGEICKAVQDKLNIPAIAGMYEENPGVDLYKRDIYIVKTLESAREMNETIKKMVNLALKIVDGVKIGKPTEEGYFARGTIKNEPSDKTAAERAVDMVMAKIKGEKFESELEVPQFDRVDPPPAIKDLSSAKIALVTDGGLVPKGNPDNMASHKSTRFASYDITDMKTLSSADFEGNHLGYDTVFVDQDPNRLVPLDIMRVLEGEGIIGELNNKMYATAGVATSIDNAKNIGKGIAKELKDAGVDAVILTST